MGVAPAGRAPNQSAIDKAHVKGNNKITLDSYYQDKDFKLRYFAASSCREDSTDIKGVQLAIKNLQNVVSTVKTFSNINSAVDALINEDVEPGKTIKKALDIATGDISGFVKNIMGRVRGWVLNTIQNNVKKVLPFLFPGEVPSFLDNVHSGINGLSCAFGKIIRGLSKTVGNLLLDLIDKYVNGPLCLVEDFISKLIKGFTNPISDAINAINSFLGDAVGKITNLADSLFNAIDFATGILNFFKCDDDKSCPVVFELDRGGSLSGSVESLSGIGALSSRNGTPYSEGYTGGEGPASADYKSLINPQSLQLE